MVCKSQSEVPTLARAGCMTNMSACTVFACSHNTRVHYSCIRYVYSLHYSDADFPDATVAAAGNKCRNPDGGKTVWCFTTNYTKNSYSWGYCDVPLCPGGNIY